MDLHSDQDDAEELEEYLKEIQRVREQINSHSLASAFENVSFDQRSGGGSSAHRSEPASMAAGMDVERQHRFSPRRPSTAGIMGQLLATTSATPHFANEQQNFQSTAVAPNFVRYTAVPPGIVSPLVNSFNQYSNLQGGFVTEYVAFPDPMGILERISRQGILSPFVNNTFQYTGLQEDTVTNNLAFPSPFLAPERSVPLGVLPPSVNSGDRYSNLGDNLGSPGLVLAAEANIQPGSFFPSLRDNIVLARALQLQTNRIQGHLRELSLRGRHQRAGQRAFVNPQNPTEHQQETRFHVSGQVHGNRVVGTGSNPSRPPASRVHSQHLRLNPGHNRQPDNIMHHEKSI